MQRESILKVRARKPGKRETGEVRLLKVSIFTGERPGQREWRINNALQKMRSCSRGAAPGQGRAQSTSCRPSREPWSGFC